MGDEGGKRSPISLADVLRATAHLMPGDAKSRHTILELLGMEGAFLAPRVRWSGPWMANELPPVTPPGEVIEREEEIHDHFPAPQPVRLPGAETSGTLVGRVAFAPPDWAMSNLETF